MWLKNIIEADYNAACGGDAPCRQPRHAGWKIEPGGGYAAEERIVNLMVG